MSRLNDDLEAKSEEQEAIASIIYDLTEPAALVLNWRHASDDDRLMCLQTAQEILDTIRYEEIRMRRVEATEDMDGLYNGRYAICSIGRIGKIEGVKNLPWGWSFVGTGVDGREWASTNPFILPETQEVIMYLELAGKKRTKEFREQQGMV